MEGTYGDIVVVLFFPDRCLESRASLVQSHGMECVLDPLVDASIEEAILMQGRGKAETLQCRLDRKAKGADRVPDRNALDVHLSRVVGLESQICL